MHNLAIALHLKGYNVTGSDDEIFDPAKSRLAKYGLLPNEEGWHPERITRNLDAIVLGMHARADNPELQKAQELGLRIYSYPEYLYEQSKDKTRVVIGGSHGKTTTTAMILHVLAHAGIEADYMVGAQLEGFEVMVRLSETAKVMVIEGDEYLTSPIDRRPKFHVYMPNIAVVTGIEWDHVNVFPTFDIYKDQFAQFIDLIRPEGTLIYCADDAVVREVAEANKRTDIAKLPYDVPQYEVSDGVTSLIGAGGERTPLKVFGRHNLLNMTAARLVCRTLGVSDEVFNEAISTFGGASKRLELVKKNDRCAVYKDFAHAPSKLRATIHAMHEQYPDRRLVACMELHTFSSLSLEFLKQYHNSMTEADTRFVYYSKHALQLKKLPDLDPSQVQAAFGDGVHVFTDSSAMVAEIIQLFKQSHGQPTNLLMMSSGNFDGIDFAELSEKVIQ